MDAQLYSLWRALSVHRPRISGKMPKYVPTSCVVYNLT